MMSNIPRRKHHVRHTARHLAPAPHSDREVRLLEGERVVDAVPDHRDVASAAAEQPDEPLLLLRRDPPEDRVLLGHLLKLLVVERVQLQSRHALQVLREPRLLCERRHGVRAVARNHLESDPRARKLTDRVLHLGA
jgi:hypothetical protein